MRITTNQPLGLCRAALLMALLALLGSSGQVQAADSAAQWIWLGSGESQPKVYFRKVFSAPSDIKKATLVATCDNGFTAFLNGRKILSGKSWEQLEVVDIRDRLTPGENVLAVEATNEGGIAAFLAAIRIVEASGQTTNLVSDSSWVAAHQAKRNWNQTDFDSSSWTTAEVVHQLGKGPWAQAINADVVESMLSGVSEGNFVVRTAPEVVCPEGFVVEKVFQVPKSMGSWVSLTNDNQGRLIASDQGGAGLFLMEPGAAGVDGSETKVQKLPVDFSSAQGMIWAFDSLYAMVNGPNPGLYRLRDTDGDGLLDSTEYLLNVPGGGEHGPHAVILSPDGKNLYICAGNHTNLPDEIAGSRIPRNWGEDHLLPRRWDANGHAAGKLAPGGWIAKIDPNGKQVEVISMGYRNQYDIAFNADGELFSYDADMEWDLGSPWYRPTRVCHATSGSEFGWRSGTGKWPSYYEDSLPSVVDIGPGSPVGISFGYGAKFPAKYQKALFLLDWTYSTIYAVHLTPDGSSYEGVKEDFVSGSPLSVTDSIIGADGSLYFAVGGRGTQSAVYRVRYIGNESTEPVNAEDSAGRDARELRRSLEKFHGKNGSIASAEDWDLVIGNLGNKDRFIRYAARIAMESQNIESWRSKALAADTTQAKINSAIALARQGKPDDLPAVLKMLSTIKTFGMDESLQLGVMRAYELAFIRLGRPDNSQAEELVSQWEDMYPAKSDAVNAELVQLLVYLNSEKVVSKTLAHMQQLGAEPVPDWGYLTSRNSNYGGTVAAMMANMPPARGIGLAFVLRNATRGWNMDLRREYFEFFAEAAKHPGGASYPGFLEQMREDAVQKLSAQERIVLADVMSQSLRDTFTSTPPKGPGRKWSTSEGVAVVGENLKGRNYDRGRNLFHATSCANCHRYNGEGGAIGPDLTTAGKKFALPDLLDAIIEPSKVISDQFGSQQVLTSDGKILIGRVVEIDDKVYVYTIQPNTKPIVLEKDDIESMTDSKISQMPEGLIDTLNEEELKDLIAYLQSGGDKKSPIYRK